MPRKERAKEDYQNVDSLTHFEALLRDALDRSVNKEEDDQNVSVGGRGGDRSGRNRRDR